MLPCPSLYPSPYPSPCSSPCPSQRHGLHLCDLKPHDLSSELLLLAEEYEAQLGEAGHLVQEAEAEKQEAEAEMVR